MKLSRILQPQLISCDMKATTKEAAFTELADLLCAHNSALDKELIVEAIGEREKQQSTYLGNGLAMPHARIEGLDDFIIACGRSNNGIVFSETNDTVHVIAMVLSCKTKINTLLQTLGAFARFFSNAEYVESLMQASSPEAFIEVVEKSGLEVKNTIVAKDIMQKNVFFLRPHQTIKEVIDFFFAKNISGAPVIDEAGHVVGSLTEKELIAMGIPKYMSMMEDVSFLQDFEPFEKFFEQEDQILVKDVMSTNFTFVHANVAVIQLAFYFVHKSCRRILVLDDNRKLQGLIMRKDLIRKVIHA